MDFANHGNVIHALLGVVHKHKLYNPKIIKINWSTHLCIFQHTLIIMHFKFSTWNMSKVCFLKICTTVNEEEN